MKQYAVIKNTASRYAMYALRDVHYEKNTRNYGNYEVLEAQNHVFLNMLHRGNVNVHVTCKKLCHASELYPIFNLALRAITCICPRYIKSKRSHASFKLVQGCTLGCACSLRRTYCDHFFYKWSFLSPGCGVVMQNNKGQGYGIEDIFVFELDMLDVSTFQVINGVEFSFS